MRHRAEPDGARANGSDVIAGILSALQVAVPMSATDLAKM